MHNFWNILVNVNIKSVEYSKKYRLSKNEAALVFLLVFSVALLGF